MIPFKARPYLHKVHQNLDANLLHTKTQRHASFGEGRFPMLDGGMELGVMYGTPACHVGHIFSVDSNTLSRSVYEPIVIQVLRGGSSLILGGKGGVRGQVWNP
jgi:hypothetical protein